MSFSVSCVIPCWNDGKSLGRSIQSSVYQLQAPAEVLVLDDYSTDGSREVAQHWADQCLLVKLHAYPAKSVDWVQAMLRNALAMTTGTHLHFLGANDYLLSNGQANPGHFYALAARYPDAGIIFGDWHVRYPNDRTALCASGMLPGVPSTDALRKQLCKPQFCEGGPALLVRRDVLEWLVERQFWKMGTWHDSIGYSAALWLFGGAYLSIPCGVLNFNPDSYGERNKHDPAKAVPMWDAVGVFLKQVETRERWTQHTGAVTDALRAKVWNSLGDASKYAILTREQPA